MEESADLNEVLDSLMALHGFSSRYEARRWLIEARDTLTRVKLTKGAPAATVSSDEHFTEKGEIVVKRGKSKIRIANPQRKLIGDDGYTRSDVSLEPTPPPEVRTLPIPTGFQAAYDERRWKKDSRRKETSGAKLKRVTNSRKTGKRVKAEHDPSLQTRPKPGTDGEIVYEVLIKHNWNRATAVRELEEHPHFIKRKPNLRMRQKTLAAQMTMVRQRYGPG